MKRIGILGGTFNPIHKGHLNLAGALTRILRLERVIFVPARIPPHKKIHGNATSGDRVRMVRLALKGRKRFSVSDCEIKKKGKSYSIDTLKAFKKRYGLEAKIFFLTGADSIKSLSKWKAFKKIIKTCEFVAASRPGYRLRKKLPGVRLIHIKPCGASSTEIRKKIKKGKPVTKALPAEVLRYIKKKALYKT